MSNHAGYDQDVLGRAFPFLFVLDRGLSVVRCGKRLSQVATGIQLGELMGESLRVERPLPCTTFEQLKSRIDDVFIINVTPVVGLRLRGQFFVAEEAGQESLVFLGHPWITELSQLAQFGLQLADFPAHAGIADMLVLLQAQTRGLAESRTLAEQVQTTSRELEIRNKQLEEELERRKRLEETVLHSQKMEAIGQLAGGVAHDFNNILLAITGHVALAKNAFSPDHPATADLQRILDATTRAAELTSRLLAFGRRQVMVPCAVDVGDALDEVVQILKPLLGEWVRVEVAQSSESAVVEIDPSALQQILLNLAINARDAFDKDGTVLIEYSKAEVTEKKMLPTGELSPGMWVGISVSDNGSGMDQDTVDRMFEPFFTTKAPGQGTGLGLSTVWWILERCGGKIDVESELGVGTKFTVYLPACSDEVDFRVLQREEAASESEQAGRILLVEDEDIVRAPVAEMLRISGWEVVEACDGEDALAQVDAAESDFDIALSDMIMPGMDGRQLAQELNSRFPEMPIVLMTGYDAGAASGMLSAHQYILTKPFTLEALVAMLDKALGSASE